MAHYVIGDTHGKYALVEKLIEKLKETKKFNPQEDFVYFLGDYFGAKRNNNTDSVKLMEVLNNDYEPDLKKPGFHLLKGNHEWCSHFRDHLKEVYGDIVIAALPDIVVLRLSGYTFCLSHAGMNNEIWKKIKQQLPEEGAAEFFLNDKNLPCFIDVVDERGQNGHTFKDKSKEIPAEYWPKDIENTYFFHGHLPTTKPLSDIKGYGVYCYKNLTNDTDHGIVSFNPLRNALNIDTGAHGRYNFPPTIACVCLEDLIKSIACVPLENLIGQIDKMEFVTYSVEERP